MDAYYDVVISGGSTAAVAAAVAASRTGARVFLAAAQLYLGEDLCDTLRLELDADQQLDTPLAEALFDGRRSTTPLRVKKTLDRALLDAGVDFEFGCMVVGARPCGDGAGYALELASRMGRRIVETGAVIDASARASLARAAGATARRWPSQSVTFERTLIVPDDDGGARSEVRRFELELPDGSFRSMARAEQDARDLTYTDGQLRGAGTLFLVPPDPIVSAESTLEATPFRPKRLDRFFVLSGCADIPREEAAERLRPTAMMAIGESIGAIAAAEALEAGALTEPSESDYAPINARNLPTLGRYDVVVNGGGTSGAAAAIAVARRGASVLLVEYQHALGGIGTLGLIGKPWYGRKAGFATETPFPDDKHNIEHKMQWLRRQLLDAGGEIWLGAIACGARVSENPRANGPQRCVTGVVVAAPGAYGVVECDVAIDSTGNADIAAAAGCECRFGAAEDGLLALQGAGLPQRPLGSDYQNSDYLLVDECSASDVRRTVVGTRMTMPDNAYDAGPMIQSRERRRIVGEHVLTYLDQLAGRTYADSIVHSASDYDSHGYPVETYFALIPHDAHTLTANHPAPGGACYTPYRCLIPRGLDGLLVTGTAISMKRDASAMVRMQFDLLNQGYAAGIAAMMASSASCGVRDIDVRALQRELVELDTLPAEAIEQDDNFPLDDDVVAQAAADVVNPDRDTACRALAIVLSHASTAMDELERHFDDTDGEAKLTYAKILGTLGNGRGLIQLLDALTAAEWDAKIFQGNMAEYAHLPTPVDALVLALGAIGDERSLPPLLAMCDQLDASVTLSHHRSIALALETLARPEACEPLARLLQRPEMRGHQMTAIEALYDRPVAKRRREGSLRELILARALYRCGDRDQLGEAILHAYADDLRGLFAEHAKMVLESTSHR